MLGKYDRWEPHKSLSVLQGLKETQKPRTIGHAWRKVPHLVMIKNLILSLEEEGFEVGKNDIRFYLLRGNADIACSIVAKNEEFGSVSTKVKKAVYPLYPSVGFIASNAHRQGLTFYGGLASLEMGLSHVATKQKGAKYTTNFDPESETRQFIENWKDTLQDTINLSKELQETSVNRNQIIRYMTEAGSANLLPWSRAGRLIDSIRGSTCSKWHLLMRFSNIVAMSPPSSQMEQQYLFSQLLRDDNLQIPEEKNLENSVK